VEERVCVKSLTAKQQLGKLKDMAGCSKLVPSKWSAKAEVMEEQC
jgi:hypothetical protein